eukprot:3884995-Prymnesium_polylepis.1
MELEGPAGRAASGTASSHDVGLRHVSPRVREISPSAWLQVQEETELDAEALLLKEGDELADLGVVPHEEGLRVEEGGRHLQVVEHRRHVLGAPVSRATRRRRAGTRARAPPPSCARACSEPPTPRACGLVRHDELRQLGRGLTRLLLVVLGSASVEGGRELGIGARRVRL